MLDLILCGDCGRGGRGKRILASMLPCNIIERGGGSGKEPKEVSLPKLRTRLVCVDRGVDHAPAGKCWILLFREHAYGPTSSRIRRGIDMTTLLYNKKRETHALQSGNQNTSCRRYKKEGKHQYVHSKTWGSSIQIHSHPTSRVVHRRTGPRRESWVRPLLLGKSSVRLVGVVA